MPAHPPPSPDPLRSGAATVRAGAALEIRPVMAADLPGITAVQADILRRGVAVPGVAPMDLRQVTALRESLVVRGYPCLVALRDGAVVGFAFAQPFGAREAWRATVEATVAVHPDAAGQGAGRALLASLIAACEAKGFRQMIAVLGAGTAGEGMVALHQALGFSHAGMLRGVGLVLGAPVDSLLLQRALGEARARSAA